MLGGHALAYVFRHLVHQNFLDVLLQLLVEVKLLVFILKGFELVRSFGYFSFGLLFFDLGSDILVVAFDEVFQILGVASSSRAEVFLRSENKVVGTDVS